MASHRLPPLLLAAMLPCVCPAQQDAQKEVERYRQLLARAIPRTCSKPGARSCGRPGRPEEGVRSSNATWAWARAWSKARMRACRATSPIPTACRISSRAL